MSHPPPQLDRFFLHPQYSIQYRHVRSFQWSNKARADYAAFFLLNGQLKYETGDQQGEMKGKQLLLVEPSESAIAKGQGGEFLLLTISSAMVIDYAVRMSLVGAGATVVFPRRVIERDELLFQLAEGLAKELVEEKAGREIVVAAFVEQIMVHLLRHHSNMRRSDHLELSRVGLVDRRIRRAVELMHARLEEDLSLKEIAAASYLSPFHFARLFKKVTGATPHAYLAGLRTARAERLLAETDLSITQISSRVGYSSPSHFTKAFRQATGLSPRAFRKALVMR